MELDERKRRVLSIIADLYTKTGEPVGSKVVSLYLDSAYSPATIRNDMAALFDLGLLEQPHTSAGRVPSHLGYRVFVDELMQVKPVSGKLRDSIEAMFNIRDPDPDKLLQDAAKALSEITGCAAFTSTHTPDTVTVQPGGDYSLGGTRSGHHGNDLQRRDPQPGVPGPTSGLPVRWWSSCGPTVPENWPGARCGRSRCSIWAA